MIKIYTGIDLVEISRILRLIDKSEDRFLTKHFTQKEIEYGRLKGLFHFAGFFAVKEAAYKALKLNWTTGFNWKNIETTHTTDGIPQIKLYGSFLEHYNKNGFTNIDVSISYAGEYATAVISALQLQP